MRCYRCNPLGHVPEHAPGSGEIGEIRVLGAGPKENHIAVSHRIVLALQAQQALFAG